ncbi:uncharacterized protein DS421_13g425090 [Arachis hypogaea]|nr:uncharacterized protein DS421_13g425090 [Arachis hypogaea]
MGFTQQNYPNTKKLLKIPKLPLSSLPYHLFHPITFLTLTLFTLPPLLFSFQISNLTITTFTHHHPSSSSHNGGSRYPPQPSPEPSSSFTDLPANPAGSSSSPPSTSPRPDSPPAPLTIRATASPTTSSPTSLTSTPSSTTASPSSTNFALASILLFFPSSTPNLSAAQSRY